MALPRMRDAAGVIRELKAQDPDTEISLHFIRGLIKSGKVPVVQAGSRKLVNMDLVFDYLANQGTEEPITYGRMRRVV